MHLINNVNAEEINSALISLREEIEKDRYFKTNAIYSVCDTQKGLQYAISGVLTSSKKKIEIVVNLPRFVASTSIYVQILKANISTVSGAFLPSEVDGGYDFVTNANVKCSKLSDTQVLITITSDTLFQNGTDNTPVAVVINKLQLQFK